MELHTTPSLFPGVPAIEIANEFSVPINKPIQVATIPTEGEESAKMMVTIPEEV